MWFYRLAKAQHSNCAECDALFPAAVEKLRGRGDKTRSVLEMSGEHRVKVSRRWSKSTPIQKGEVL